MIRGLGYLPDERDDRDQGLGILLGADAAAPPPARASVRSHLVEPKDQGPTQSCVGQATAQGLRLSFLAAGRPCPDLSALHAYYLGRAEFGGQRRDEGSYLRSSIKALQHYGCAEEHVWPFIAERVNRRPSWAADHSGHDRKGWRSYHRCYSPDDVRRAIAAGAAVVGGWKVDDAFMDHTGPGVIDVPRGEIRGGHAVVVEAYEADGTFRILNSWSRSWGLEGRARVSEAWIASGHDLWALAVSP